MQNIRESLSGKYCFLTRVCFAYDPKYPVLHNTCFKINCGERIGICGPTGSGKSTVVSLIARFYDPLSGRVLIDGTDISDFTLDGLRNQSDLFCRILLFFMALFVKISRMEDHMQQKKKLLKPAKLANAHEFISRMPHGYDTLVGERGVTLSGGQKQRIGIARAVVRNSPILILDEPTASSGY